MRGLFGEIFGTKSAINKGLDLITAAGDVLIFTDEEKAQQK